MTLRIAIFLFSITLMAACDSQNSYESTEQANAASTEFEEAEPNQLLDEPVVEQDFGLPEDQATFNGYDCTQDCSGHEAGYSWAEDNEIDDVDNCSANSNSFNEGCIEYVEENYGDDSSGGSSSYDPNLYTNCDEARDNGEESIDSSNPRFGDHLDADGDGIGCEPYSED